VAQGSPPRRFTWPSAPGHGHRAGGVGAAARAGGGERSESDRQARPGPDRPGSGNAFADDDLPPWAVLSRYPAGPGRGQHPPPDRPAGRAGSGESWPPSRRSGQGRAAAARLRRSRHRVLAVGIGAAVVVLAATVVWLVSRPGPAGNSSYVTTLQPGEFRAVPDACRAVSAAMLSRDLAGVSRPKLIRSSPAPLQSQCGFTADAPPVFRVLQVSVQAFQPSLLAPGNGSATANATAAYVSDLRQLARPAKKSPQPRAVITPLTGLGQAAFSAQQVFRLGGGVSYRVTVTARDRNALVTVSLQGIESAPHGRYGPVSRTQLAAAALATAREVLARAVAEPTASG
jgi:hypothetical protein